MPRNLRFLGRIGILCSAAYLVLGCAVAGAETSSLPGAYFYLLKSGCEKLKQRFKEEPNATLQQLEARSGWRHFPQAVLAPAVLYAKQHPENPYYRDPKMLELALQVGDFLAQEGADGRFRLGMGRNWDAHIWLEAYRLLEKELGEERKKRWARGILANIEPLIPLLKERLDFPWYQSPFIGTSPNHYSNWAAFAYEAGLTFGKKDWVAMGRHVLRRFAMREQSEDGYWGEHNNQGPTTGYNHLTLTGIALYWELSGDKDVLPALRRALDFHMNYTYPDGHPVEVINDRNRRWGVSRWGHFAFTNFPEGRRYAEFLLGFHPAKDLPMHTLGRMAQSTLYYHEGPTAPIPQDRPRYVHRMKIPAGIRKTEPWTVVLSGIYSTTAATRQFYLDRQGNFSVFHEKLGMIITGANSKWQPELATFREKYKNQIFHTPVSSRLEMTEDRDRLSLAYETFFADLFVPEPTKDELKFRFSISGRGRPPEEAELNLQLVLKAGETLETGVGKKFVLGTDKIELGPEEIGGWIRHHGWTMKLDPTARLVWPIYPYYPYGNRREDLVEKSVEHAVGRLSVPLRMKAKPGHYVRPDEQEIAFTVTVD